jgi:hypothetical protein
MSITGNPWTDFKRERERERERKPTPKDWTGRRYGKLTALHYRDHGKYGAQWAFRCAGCGSEKVLPIIFVQAGTLTCGCKPKKTGWPFPVARGLDGLPVSPIHRAALATGNPLPECLT